MMNTDTNQTPGTGAGTLASMQDAPGYQGEMQGTSQGTKRKMSEKAREAGTAVKENARMARDKMKEQGTQAAERLQNRGKAMVEERKGEVASRIEGYGSAVRRAADKLREEEDPNIAGYADAIASRLESAGEYVRSCDLGMMMNDVGNAARRRPELFFGGMFLAGLALSRFMKTSAEDNYYDSDADTEDYWVEEGYDSEMGYGPVGTAGYESPGGTGMGTTTGMGSMGATGAMGTASGMSGSGSSSSTGSTGSTGSGSVGSIQDALKASNEKRATEGECEPCSPDTPGWGPGKGTTKNP